MTITRKRPPSMASRIPSRPGISRATLEAAGIRIINTPEEGTIELPYFNILGKRTGFSRFRLRRVRPSGQKYHQAKGSDVFVYFPPEFHRSGPGGDLVIVEGEFKSLALHEAGAKVIGLPSFNTYMKGKDGSKRLLSGIHEAIDFIRPDRVLFVGDSDTALNAAFSRNAAFLAEAIHPMPVTLPRIPIGGPKGIDDVKEERKGGFDHWWSQSVETAEPVSNKTTMGALAVRLLNRELPAIKATNGQDFERAEQRLIRMGTELRQESAALGKVVIITKDLMGISATDVRKAIKEEFIRQAGKDRGKDNSDHVPPNADEDELVTKYGEPFPEGSNTLNPQYFVALFLTRHLLIFEPIEGAFYTYHGKSGLWVDTTVDEVKMLLADEIKNLADVTGKPWLLNKASDSSLNGYANLLKGRAAKRGVFSSAIDYVHVLNGVLIPNGDEWQLKEFSPEYYSRNQIPFEFDESAQWDRFDTELLQPALDDDDIGLLQILFGSVLLGRNRAQLILVITGTPGGGKSTVVNVLEGVIGPENVTQLRTEHLGSRFETRRFVGKQMLAAKDVPGDFLQKKNASILKALVGGDGLSTETKGGIKVPDITGNYSVAITANTRLRVKLDGDAGAWERRLAIINYERPATAKPIPEFDKILLKDEGPGILNWLLIGATEFLRQMGTAGRVTFTKKQKERVTNLLCESDSLRLFVKRCVTSTKGRDVTSTELQEAYAEFCDSMGWAPIPASHVERELKDHMVAIHRLVQRNDIKRDGTSRRGYSNTEILTHDEAYD